MSGERILVMAHGHPDLILGGAEIAAHGIYRAYRAAPGVEAAWFLARANRGHGATGRIARHRPGEFLWEQSLRDLFFMEADNHAAITGQFADLIATLRPTVVHSHHYLQFGLEYLKVIKDVDPRIRTVLTLHEYMVICPNHGQMLVPGTGQPCQSGEAARHLACAPDHSASDHWLRQHRFLRYFDFVDHFISPSHFLRDRHVEWGIAPDRISVIENGQPPLERLPPRPMGEEGRNRFGFFGQINPYKGLDLLLEGLNRLGPAGRAGIVLEVHGANLDRQLEAFQDRIAELSAPLVAEGVLRWIGPYAPADLPGRMAGVDWVMVPSIWYENSPLVIQEAYALGRPVIATGHGALAEKVTHGVTGLTLPRANPMAWAEAMQRLARDSALWDRLQAGLPRPPSLTESAADHLALMARLQGVAA